MVALKIINPPLAGMVVETATQLLWFLRLKPFQPTPSWDGC